MDLAENYFANDLTYDTVLKKIAELSAAKRDDIPHDTIRAWFCEFVRRNWTEEIFSERFRAVMSTKKYGVVSIDDWFESEIKYTEEELQYELSRLINKRINRGREIKQILDSGVKLTDEEQKNVDLFASKEFENELRLERYRVMSEALEQEKQRLRDQERERWNTVKEFTDEQKSKLVQLAMERGELEYSNIQYPIYLQNLRIFSASISNETILEVQNA